MNSEDIKILIKKVLDGNGTSKEIELLEKFEKTVVENNKATIFADDNQKKIVQKSIYKKVKRHIRPNQFFGLRIAASIALLVGIGYATMNWIYHSKQIMLSNNTKTSKEITLPDGSVVQLNVNSKITYDNTFNTKERNISLEGEAFFKVSKNKQKPFIIKTGSLNTKVVGTQFNIKQDLEDVCVTVVEGQVKVYHDLDTVSLTINEQAVFNLKTKLLVEQEVNAGLFNTWFKKTIVLESVKLEEVTKLIEQLYSTKVVFRSPELKSTTLSLTFQKNESIEHLINTINLISEVKLTINKTNGTIEIEKLK